MTKQEEIREGMDKVIYDRIMSFLTEDDWKDVAPNEHPKTALCGRLTTEVLEYLHSQGVVIKKEGKLPENPIMTSFLGLTEEEASTKQMEIDCFMKVAQTRMLVAGYVLVEPLIEEE